MSDPLYVDWNLPSLQMVFIICFHEMSRNFPKKRLNSLRLQSDDELPFEFIAKDNRNAIGQCVIRFVSDSGCRCVFGIQNRFVLFSKFLFMGHPFINNCMPSHRKSFSLLQQSFQSQEKWVLLQNFVEHQAKEKKTPPVEICVCGGSDCGINAKMCLHWIAYITLKLVLNKSLEWAFDCGVFCMLECWFMCVWRQKGHQHFRFYYNDYVACRRLCYTHTHAHCAFHPLQNLIKSLVMALFVPEQKAFYSSDFIATKIQRITKR